MDNFADNVREKLKKKFIEKNQRKTEQRKKTHIVISYYTVQMT